MSHKNEGKISKPQIIDSSRPFFAEMIEIAVRRRKVAAPQPTRSYLVDLLEHYMISGNLFDQAEGLGGRSGTLAERYLTAANAEPSVRAEMLKKLGDTSLYISGFFGDSLQRKLVDIDYYAGIGGSAYGTLAAGVSDEHLGVAYRDLSARFLDYVDVLTFISQQSLVQTDEDLLRLYSRYVLTGSRLAEEQLIEKGVLAPGQPGKINRQ